MYGRSDLDRFKKSQTSEPFSVSANPPAKPVVQRVPPEAAPLPSTAQTQIGASQSTWHPPDWAIEPRAGVYSLEVVKDGQILDRIHLNRRRHIFGRQHQTCDFVLDHQSVSRQHAVVVPHKNGSIFVIDLGSAHGTFVANERLTKDTPVELEVGQSLRFAASTRIYILRKNSEALFTRPPPPSEIKLPPPPDPSDEEAVVAYNTLLNRYGLSNGESGSVLGKRKEKGDSEGGVVGKRRKKLRVSFRDQLGGELAEVVGMSDGADVETEHVDRIVKESLCNEDDDISSSLCSESPANVNGGEIEPKSPNVMISASEQRDVGGIMKRVKEKWLSRLHKARSKEKGEDHHHSSEAEVSGSGRIERVKVKEYKKEAKELSALFKGQEIQAHEGAILAMKFSPDGRYLASAGEDKVLRVWSVVEDERCEEHDVPKMDPSCIYFEVSNLSELRPVAVEKDSVNGGSLMSPRKTTESACVIIPPKIFRVVDKPAHEFLGHSGDILDVSWSKNNRLLSASADSSVRLWQIGREDCLGIYSHSNYVTSVQFNPVDDDHFITGSIDGKVRIWSASRYQVVDWVDARSIVTAVCYRPDGQGVIIGTLTSECRFYNVTGHCLQLDGHICLHNKKKSSNKRIISFQFDSTDPSRVMVASADSQVRIISGRNVVHKYKGSRNAGNQISASFTGDGKHIISACDDSSVYVWNCVPHDPEPPSPGFFSHTKRIKIRSFEKFSADVSVAIPWCGFSSPGISGGSELSPSLFSLGREYVLDSPKGAATWPEEKLASSFSPVRAIRRSHYRFLRSSCRRTAESSHLWGLVIVTGGWDGRIRLFHNYGLPVPV